MKILIEDKKVKELIIRKESNADDGETRLTDLCAITEDGVEYRCEAYEMLNRSNKPESRGYIIVPSSEIG